jgi:peptidoglycan/LPS O-acetylase OafA/YrhL
MCYTIYLFHFLLISACERITKRLYLGGGFAGYFALQGALVLPVVLAVCGVYYLLIERPGMDKTWPQKVAGTFRRFRAGKVTSPTCPMALPSIASPTAGSEASMPGLPG